jgi:Dolichyl-phosphate-mannose-protein mannosyltransferase
MSVSVDHDQRQPVDPEPVPRRWRYWPPLAVLGAGIVLTAFGFWSQTVGLANRRFSHPPIYGAFEPHVSRLALLLVPAGVLLAAVGWVVTSARRIPTWLALASIVGAGWLMSIAVNLVRGDKRELYAGASTSLNAPYYTRDLHFVDQYGVRGFVQHYPGLVKQLGAYNGKTHPPGIQVMLWTIARLIGDHPFRFTTVLALIALLIGAGAWALGRAYGGEPAGRIAAVLAVAAPGPLMLAYTNMDVIFAALFSISGALFVVGARRRSAVLVAAGGAVAGLTTFLTYATSFLVLAVVVAIAVEVRGVRQTVRLLVAAAAGGLAVLILLRLTLGFDLWACYQARTHSGGPFYPYWTVGHPASVLIWAGLPLAALGVAGLFVRVPGARRPVLPLVLVAGMVVWGLLPPVVTDLRQGEVERTWAFLYPMLAAAAGPVVARWTDSTRLSRTWSGSIVFALVVLSVTQAGVLQALWDNLV